MSYDKQERMSALEESDEVFYAKMQKGLDDVRNGRITPLDDVYAELSKAISEIKNGAPVTDAEKFIKAHEHKSSQNGVLNAIEGERRLNKLAHKYEKQVKAMMAEQAREQQAADNVASEADRKSVV